jgi:hypothetical protein
VTAHYCPRCGKPILADEHGDRRCQNGHALHDSARLLDALSRMVPVLSEIREAIDRLEAKVDITAPPAPAPVQEEASWDGWVELATMARMLKVSDDWLRRRAKELGGVQSVKGGRWKFHPPRTMSLFGQRDQTRPTPAPAPVRALPLPDRVPLLEVKDRAA